MKLDTSQENGERIIIPTKYKTNILDKLLTFTGHKKVKTAAKGIIDKS